MRYSRLDRSAHRDTIHRDQKYETVFISLQMSGCKYDNTSGLRFISLTEMLGDVILWTSAPVLNTCVCPVQYLQCWANTNRGNGSKPGMMFTMAHTDIDRHRGQTPAHPILPPDRTKQKVDNTPLLRPGTTTKMFVD